jgi:adenine-specific DNA methylase
MPVKEFQVQELLFPFDQKVKTSGVFPQTRYQGSKYKLLEWLRFHFEKLNFESALDLFGGTGSVGFLFKQMGKKVVYNDYLKFNSNIATALIENNHTYLDENDIEFLLKEHSNIQYPTFIYNTFKDIYFTDEENLWLDQTITNINLIADKYKQSTAYFALFQACIIKRPYNLFHRKNLYVRLAEVSRTFGNKKTWDTSFETLFVKFIEQANGAIFDNGKNHLVLNQRVEDLTNIKADLVYIDPPYISSKGTGVNYFDFYHFLEGISDYENWSGRINYKSKNLKLSSSKSRWVDKNLITDSFEKLLNEFQSSILVISYRDDGIPSISKIVEMLEKLNKKVSIHTADYKYVLSNSQSKEVLIVAI